MKICLDRNFVLKTIYTSWKRVPNNITLKKKKLKILTNFISINKLFQHSCLTMRLPYQFAFKCNFVYFLICSLRIKIKTLMYVHFIAA